MDANTTTQGHRSIVAETIVQLVRRSRFDLSSEKKLQADLEEALKREGIAYEREKRLSGRDIPDFFIDGVVVECKMHKKAQKMAIFKQLSRYAEHVDVKAIVLASNVPMGLPKEINGKPLYAASLSTGWL